MTMAQGSSTYHRIRRGLDLPIFGVPEQRVEDCRSVSQVAVVAADHAGLRPRMVVTIGDRVVRGQALFEDRRIPSVRYTSPGTGTVAAIHRGDRRALLAVVIDLDEDEDPQEVEYEFFTGRSVDELTPDEIRALLIESGEWTAFRVRPFSHVPPAVGLPRSIFVTAIDSAPLSPDVDVAIAGREKLFAVGLAAISKLAEGRSVHLCKRAGSAITAGAIANAVTHEFVGPHPSGTVGLHIHLIDPVDRDRAVWHLGYQDVCAIGGLLSTGRRHLERVIALAGPVVKRPRLLRVRLGARIDDLVEEELAPGINRIVSGSVLSGRLAAGPELGFLGRFHNQISALSETHRHRFLGWLWPGSDRFSASRLFLSRLLPSRRFPLDTEAHGGRRVMIPSGAYERVLPFDVLPVFLLRALLSGDLERAEELGCLELDEEDLALCSFVCPSKIDYGAALRQVLTQLEREG